MSDSPPRDPNAPRVEGLILQGFVRSLLTLLTDESSFSSGPRDPYDFRVTDAAGRQTAIEVKSRIPTSLYSLIPKLVSRAAADAEVDRFLLVTARRPSNVQRQRMTDALAGQTLPFEWVDPSTLTTALGLSGAFDSPRARVPGSQVVLAGLLKGLERYEHAPIGTLPAPDAILASLAKVQEANPTEVTVLQSLARQLPLSLVSSLRQQPGGWNDKLKVGKKIVKPFVLLSDIVNFSTLIRFGDPDSMQSIMAEYYRRAREAVWDHGGVFDKFVGDSVVAVWGFPSGDDRDPLEAVACALELTQLGAWLTGEFEAVHNEAIESGTRVGIAQDLLWTLNIGIDVPELSFVGNGINLAARLENACPRNGIMIDNKTFKALPQPNQLGLEWVSRKLDPAQAKGQLTSVRAWEYSPVQKV